jgi:hypothetical protein
MAASDLARGGVGKDTEKRGQSRISPGTPAIENGGRDRV